MNIYNLRCSQINNLLNEFSFLELLELLSVFIIEKFLANYFEQLIIFVILSHFELSILMNKLKLDKKSATYS